NFHLKVPNTTTHHQHRPQTPSPTPHLITPAPFSSFFFFNDTATTEIYTLSLHDALPISFLTAENAAELLAAAERKSKAEIQLWLDRKSTRLNSSHVAISYAVFCLKKKKILIT